MHLKPEVHRRGVADTSFCAGDVGLSNIVVGRDVRVGGGESNSNRRQVSEI